MKQFYFLIWSVLAFMNYTVCAQDQTNFAHFYLNPYLLNPSYAGIDGKASINFIYRKQWATIQDGPRISNFSFQAPLTSRVSFGLSATNDVKGLLNNSGLNLTFGYSIPLSEGSYFRFGISGGGSWNTIDLDKLEALTGDPALANLLDKNTSLNGNAGISFHLKTFHAGIALPVIFAPSYISKDAFTITEIKPFQSFNLHLSNRFYFNKNKNVFEPYAIYRMNLYDSTFLPSQFELAGIIHLNHLVWIGGSYKQDFGISALGGVKINNAIAIGASYSLKNSGVNELNSPTYEVAIGILFGQKKKEAIAYSFVDTHFEKVKKGTGKSASERIAAQRLEQEQKKTTTAKVEPTRQPAQTQTQTAQTQTKPAQTQTQAQAQTQNQPQTQTQTQNQTQTQTQPVQTQTQPVVTQTQPVVTQTQPVVTQPNQTQTQTQTVQTQTPTQTQTQTQRRTETVAEVTTPKKDSAVHRARFTHSETSLDVLSSEVTEHSHHDEQERIKRLEVHADDPDEHHEGGDHPNAERHEFVKRGSHKQELDVADYVITGVFGQEANAKHFSDGLKKMGFVGHYGHLTEKNLWYVYVYQTGDINQARNERDRLRKMKIFRDAWLLTVHH